MNDQNRRRLDEEIRTFFEKELQKEFREDFKLIADRLEFYISQYTMKDVRAILRNEINRLKHLPFEKSNATGNDPLYDARRNA